MLEWLEWALEWYAPREIQLWKRKNGPSESREVRSGLRTGDQSGEGHSSNDGLSSSGGALSSPTCKTSRVSHQRRERSLERSPKRRKINKYFTQTHSTTTCSSQADIYKTTNSPPPSVGSKSLLRLGALSPEPLEEREPESNEYHLATTREICSEVISEQIIFEELEGILESQLLVKNNQGHSAEKNYRKKLGVVGHPSNPSGSATGTDIASSPTTTTRHGAA
ncbi:hypothetical protein BDZ45DRAFT_247385 [Acephala macrosclerotiorum]|nr:hypothetical protein BDZ45DRAFT_247385 [Acephala macrosclerotiorum]